ncbi:unnamed protein product [Phytophthora lilii]|uniref:Unnamed protein product n=1 Tax=Phytophthora lilii TaxID=2077276 RepID=A0A9W6U3H8_9STRA|nr:unnamed protein product [Phytophthora lilii]
MPQDKTPVPRPEGSNSDDEAPEVVTKQSAQEQALTQQRHEEEAREPKETEEVPELPDDVLSAVAARNEEEEAAEEQEVAAALRAEKRQAAKLAKLMQKKTHTRQFGNIQVQTLDSLEQTQARELSESAKKFLERRTAPTRPRMNVLEGHPTQFAKKKQRSK